MESSDLSFKVSDPPDSYVARATESHRAGANPVKDSEEERRWSSQWDPPLNLDKCKLRAANVDHFRNGPLLCLSEVRDLWVTFTHDFHPFRQSQMAVDKARGVVTRRHATMSCDQRKVLLPLY